MYLEVREYAIQKCEQVVEKFLSRKITPAFNR